MRAIASVGAALVLSLLPISSPGHAAPSLESEISAQAGARNFSGTIMVSERGRRRYQGSFGQADRAFAVPAAADTRFKIASITKLFTAVLILQLAERGKIDLQGSAGTYLPELRDRPAGAVTIEQLLRHVSGLPQWDRVGSYQEAFANGVEKYQRPLARKSLVGLCCVEQLTAKPGTVFNYNNADYFILGAIIERIAKKRYEDVLADQITRPLSLSDTGMLRWDAILPRLAPTYFYRDDSRTLIADMPVYYENWYSAAGMYSDADDLLRFADVLYGGKLIGRHSLDKLLEPGLDDYGYGLWSYSFERGGKRHRVAKRPGSVMGANAVLYRLLDRDTTIVILGNTNRADLDAFAQKIADLLVRESGSRDGGSRSTVRK